MSNREAHEPDAHGTPGDLPEVQAAFDRLRHQASGLDTMAARRRIGSAAHPAWRSARFLGAVVVLVIVVVGVAAYVGRGGGDPVVVGGDGGEDTANGLDGSSWVLTSGTTAEGAVTLVDGYPITLTFDGDTVGGTAACNGYGGSFELVGTSLTIGELSWTEMGCEPPVMDAEQWFLAALGSVEELVVDGDVLRLTGPSTELTFARQAEVPAAELVDQLWLLDTLIQGDAASTVMGEPATLLLNADGTLVGGTGCRTLSGEYLIAGASVQFTTFGADGDCPPDLADQDNLVVTVLGDGFTVEIDGGRMTLASMGNEGLAYRAITEDELAELGSKPDEATDDGLRPGMLPDEGPEPTLDDLAVFDAWRTVEVTAGSIDVDGLRLSPDGVRLGLTDELLVSRSPAELTDPAAWALDREDFRARVGPFSAVELLSQADEVELTVGPHNHCASPPAPIHPDLQSLRHLSIQPVGVDSCIQWFTVDLYLDDAGQVVAVTLDLWEP